MTQAIHVQYAIRWTTIGIVIGFFIGGFATILTQRVWGLLL